MVANPDSHTLYNAYLEVSGFTYAIFKMINGSCAITAPEFSGGKSHSIPMFELEYLSIASAVRIFWDIVNVTIGFNIQESSLSNLGM